MKTKGVELFVLSCRKQGEWWYCSALLYVVTSAVHSDRAVNNIASVRSNSVLCLELVLNEANQFSLFFVVFLLLLFGFSLC